MSPYGGVQPAINLIMNAMSEGEIFYYQSDIKAFFTKIPTQSIIATILKETGNKKLTDLFTRGLKVNLANKEELLSYSRLFPHGGIGVAQGSSLSAFAGNVLLYDFDHELNRLGVTAVRYIDDLLIVSASKQSLDDAVSFSLDRLGSYGLSLYSPNSGSEKASKGECKNAFQFLGCTMQPNRCVPSKQSIAKLTSEVGTTLSASKKGIKDLLSNGKPLDPNLSQSSALHALGRKIYGWQKSFAFCTDPQEFRQLDRDVFSKVSNYDNWIRDKTRTLSVNKRSEILGVPSAQKLFEQDSRHR